MQVIGITGRSGSGKSTLAKALENKGAVILDGDEIAASLMEPGSPVLERVKEAFGSSYFHDDGTLDRRKLGELVFSEARSLALLNSLVHPSFRQIIKDEITGLRARKSSPAFAVIDAAVLFEAQLDKLCDIVVAVLCDDDEAAARIARRDAMSRGAALDRIRTQKAGKGDHELAEKADIVVISRGDEAEMDLWADRIIRIAEGKSNAGR